MYAVRANIIRSKVIAPDLPAFTKALYAAFFATLCGYSFQNSSNCCRPESRARASSERSEEVSESVSVSVLSVSGGVSETFRVTSDETFPSRFLKRFTRSVETSLLYCRAFQLCGANLPVSISSNRPMVTMTVTYSAARATVTRSSIATVAIAGRVPLFFDAMHKRLNQARCCLSDSASNFGSCRASSYARHHRLIRRPVSSTR